MNTHERIRLLDILRGFAVLGTLGTNIWIFASLGDLNAIFTFDGTKWWQSVQDAVRVMVLFLVNGKLLGLLTIMFGIGMELKYRQTLQRGRAWPGVYIWTSLFLMTEGFFHFVLVMEYDILMSYGAAAIVTAFIIKRGDRAIKRTMLLVGSVHGGAMLLLTALGVALFATGGTISMDWDMSAVTALYGEGSWLEQVRYRMSDFPVLRLEALLVIPMNVFLFLLGIRLFRAGYFSPDETGRRKRSKLLRLGLCIGLPLNMLLLVPGGYFDLPVRYLFAPVLALGYIGLIAKLVDVSRELWLWSKLEQVGKLSLSSYVLQNVTSAVLFYGWGFGLGGRVDAVTVVLIWLTLSSVQMLFASWWLKRYRLGPLEGMRTALLRAVTGS